MYRHDVRRFLNRPAARGLSRKARAMYEVLLACGKPDLSGELNFGTVRDAWVMQETGYSESSVYRARRELVSAGLVIVEGSGQGRAITAYRLVLEAVGVEVELFEQRAAKLRAEARAGGFTSASSGAVVGSPGGSSQVESQTALSGHREGSEPSKTAPLTRAHPESFQELPPQPLTGSGPGQSESAPLRGTEEHMASGSAAAATSCPRASSRGEPCASCRACGTNPRARRRAAAAQRARDREQVPQPPALSERAQRTERGLAMAAAELAAAARRRAASQAAHEGTGGAPPGPPATGGDPS